MLSDRLHYWSQFLTFLCICYMNLQFITLEVGVFSLIWVWASTLFWQKIWYKRRLEMCLQNSACPLVLLPSSSEELSLSSWWPFRLRPRVGHVGGLRLTHSEESNLDPQLEAETPTYMELKLADSRPLARKKWSLSSGQVVTQCYCDHRWLILWPIPCAQNKGIWWFVWLLMVLLWLFWRRSWAKQECK